MSKINEPKKRGRPPNSTKLNTNSLVDNTTVELAAFYDVLQSYNQGAGLIDVSIKDLMLWLKNPPKYRRQLIRLSKYYYNKDGVVTDCYDMFNVMPVVNFSVLWQNMQKPNYATSKKKVDAFLSNIKVKKIVRDTIFTVIQEGTAVWYNRDNKYIQFMVEEEFRIEYMVNGKWQVFYDMEYIFRYDAQHSLDFLISKIEAAPDEVTLAAYNNYKKDGTKYRYVPLDINKTQVFKLRGSRNEPYGVPYCVPAISSIIHKDLLEKTEKALADRIINQIIIQKVGNMPSADGKIGLPVPKTTIDGYHASLKGLLTKKYDANSTDNSTTAPLTVPAFVEIDELKVNMNTFPKEVWERVDRNIYQKLGFSQSLNMGGGNGQSFGSSSINVEKIFAIIFYLVEDIEEGLNEFINLLVPTGTFNPKIWISRQTILDKETQFKNAEALFLKGRGSLKHYVEAAGYDFEQWYAQVKYENEVLKIGDLPIHATSFTQSGDNQGGAPKETNPTNDNTSKSQGNGNTKV